MTYTTILSCITYHDSICVFVCIWFFCPITGVCEECVGAEEWTEDIYCQMEEGGHYAMPLTSNSTWDMIWSTGNGKTYDTHTHTHSRAHTFSLSFSLSLSHTHTHLISV